MNQQFVHMFRSVLIAALMALGAPAPSYAQTSTSAQQTPTRNQSYLRDLVSLSDIIGSAHAVRVRCNGEDDQYWRTYMIQILGLEAPTQSSLRTEMVSAFNRGFERESSVSIGCDATANEREANYAVDGERLAAGLAAYYFPERKGDPVLQNAPVNTRPGPAPRPPIQGRR